jgi:hypothetical protein
VVESHFFLLANQRIYLRFIFLSWQASFDGFTVQVVCLVFNINLWLFELYFGLFNINFRLLSSSFNRKFDSVRNHILVSSWPLQDNFCADQLGIEHRLFPDCQPTYIFWIGQIRILHLVVLP